MAEKLTDGQRQTLSILSAGGWFNKADMDVFFANRVNALIRRGLLERRMFGGVQVRISDDGRAALREMESDK